MDEGFTLWKIIRKENELPVFRGENGNHLFVHILVLSGELKAEWTGILYPLTKNSFADFIDGRSLEIRDISIGGKTKCVKMNETLNQWKAL